MNDFDAALARVDPRAHVRLSDLETALSLDGATGSADGPRVVIPPIEHVQEWLSADRLRERVEARYDGRLHGIEAVRNVLTLLPLIITWASLSAAAYNFGYLASRNLVASEKSFLTLWQSGFDGKAQVSIPTFSEVARTDVVLFVSLIIVTLVYQYMVWWVSKKALILGDLANERLATLVVRIETWRADDAQRRMRDALISALGGTADSFAGLLTDVQDQRTRLEKMTNNQSEGLAKLAETATAMQAGAERFAAHTEKMQDLAAAIEHSSTPLATAAESLTGLRSDITGATNSLATRSGNLAEAVTAFLEEHGATRDGIRNLANALSEHGVAAANRFDLVEETANARRAEAEKRHEALEDAERQRREEAGAYFAQIKGEAQQRHADLDTMVAIFLDRAGAIQREAVALEDAHMRRVAQLNQMVMDALAALSPVLRDEVVQPLLATSLLTEGERQLAALNGGVMRLERSMNAIAMLLAEMLRGLAGEDGIPIGERPGAYVDGN